MLSALSDPFREVVNGVKHTSKHNYANLTLPKHQYTNLLSYKCEKFESVRRKSCIDGLRENVMTYKVWWDKTKISHGIFYTKLAMTPNQAR